MAPSIKESSAPDACLICGDHPVFFAEKDGYDFWRSPGCGLLFVWPYISQPPTEIYQSDYFEGAAGGFGYVDYDLEKSSHDSMFTETLERLKTLTQGTGGLLDIGAATGYFVGVAQRSGWNAQGIDVSSHSVAMAKAKGLRVDEATIENFDAPLGSFDAITMWDVIEHLPDPVSALRKSRELLKEEGILAINTPDGRSLWARMFGKRWHSLVPPEHIFIFNRQALSLALHANGFEVIESANPIKRFTLPYITNMFSRWTSLKVPMPLKRLFNSRFLASIALPVPIRDNVLMLAKKSSLPEQN